MQIDEVHLDLVPGDVVLLCTDGLSSMVDDALIEQTTAGAATLADAATALIDAALEHGGIDNVTVVLAADRRGRRRRTRDHRRAPGDRHLAGARVDAGA